MRSARGRRRAAACLNIRFSSVDVVMTEEGLKVMEGTDVCDGESGSKLAGNIMRKQSRFMKEQFSKCCKKIKLDFSWISGYYYRYVQ